ncbi:hypothetical protein JOM56_013318 [Amanita muscaria]
MRANNGPFCRGMKYKSPAIVRSVKILVRRGGPDYQQSFQAMRLLGESLGVLIRVFGPEPLALGVQARERRAGFEVRTGLYTTRSREQPPRRSMSGHRP